MVYLDYNASTPIDPAVREAMLPFLGELHGNPSSHHALGQRVGEAVRVAREQVAGMLGANPSEIIFTSGGTESNNFVIKGVAFSYGDKGKHIITSAIEHPAVIEPCRFLERTGCEISFVGVDANGRIDPQEVADLIRPDTILISIMHANNEVGTIQPIEEISAIARKHGVLMHTDAAQACGKIATKVNELGVDFLSIAGHKIYAPQGIGALYIRDGVSIEPLHHGAAHESGRRAGTEPVPALVGLGQACVLAATRSDANTLLAMRDRLWAGLSTRIGTGAVLLGHPELRLPNTLAVAFRGCIGADVLNACPELCASTGAACHAKDRKRSGVLAAMNVPEELAFGAVRFSVGRYTTEAEVDRAIDMVAEAMATSQAT